ncbi:hypothetical protein Q8W37_01095 [Shimia thalassica]|uniref:hypothetical protein n=1 Tax=Shimia thalassica TaxID=1715693 RepID=UPI000C08C08C|nr:hypothetical protein [Shimia thalassica]PHO03204.1 hypothetical protein CSC82_14945 [Rhodobacteraceae bacterium 4F10]MDO6520221.1 hypothetical protein [Shimia thalassica]MDP2492786.1 hypothetical protein [Shimia thalassica]MDP2517998.1 hypothetical protein [Shimia thalassica]MDP2578503.1 hypothetical protein [Shimia thalassica]
MTRKGWHIQRKDDTVTVARRLPARFDVSACTVMPSGGRLRLAQQIRQDMWRRLQNLRGFSPVVEVKDVNGALQVTAGGSIDGPFPRASIEEKLANLLADPDLRTRWSAQSAHREVRHG